MHKDITTEASIPTMCRNQPNKNIYNPTSHQPNYNSLTQFLINPKQNLATEIVTSQEKMLHERAVRVLIMDVSITERDNVDLGNFIFLIWVSTLIFP